MASLVQNLSRAISGNTLTYAAAGANLFLVLYASMARPQLPDFVVGLFDNMFFRLFVLTLVVYMSNQNLSVSIMVAVAFTVTMNLLNEQKIAEGFVSGIQEGMISENFLDDMGDLSDPDDSDMDDME